MINHLFRRSRKLFLGVSACCFQVFSPLPMLRFKIERVKSALAKISYGKRLTRLTTCFYTILSRVPRIWLVLDCMHRRLLLIWTKIWTRAIIPSTVFRECDTTIDDFQKMMSHCGLNGSRHLLPSPSFRLRLARTTSLVFHGALDRFPSIHKPSAS